MDNKIIHALDIRDQLIAALKQENELQRKIINEQQNTIDVLEEQLEKFQQLMKQMLNS